MKSALRIWLGLLVASTVCILIASAAVAQREANPYLVETRMLDGHPIDMVVVPGRPPAFHREPAAAPPPPDSATMSLPDVPAFTWCYGCSATSAAMMMGWYDRFDHSNMYAGPANGGLCPLNNETTWGHTSYPKAGLVGYCPLSATKNGLDGRVIKGHVDDYWVDYGNSGDDPYVGNWTEHTHGDCTGDYMGTNQDYFNSSDGSTTFFYYGDGTATYDVTAYENPPDPNDRARDGAHGMRLFVNSRGYTLPMVSTPYQGMQYNVFNQYRLGLVSPTKGFSFDQYKNEIDNWRPVLIHVSGHTMLGFGYNDTGSLVYLCDTWDNIYHEMPWGGSYSGLAHLGVTCLDILEPLPVILVGLRAEGAHGRVRVSWETATEATAAGYVVLRSDRLDGPFERISAGVIAATGQPGEIAKYEFVDETAQPGRLYFYRIGEVSPGGAIREIPDTARSVAGGPVLYNLLPPQLRTLLRL